MRGKLSGLKNIIWAFGIVVCLLAVLVGFIIAAVSKYDGEQEKGAINLGGTADIQDTSDKQEEPAGEDMPVSYGDGTLHELAESADGGQAYVDTLTFLCDSTLIGLRDYGMLTGGAATSQVWGSAAGNIPASSISTCTIRYPGDGSEISPADAAMVTKPEKLVISLGMDSLQSVTKEEFISAYTTLVGDIRRASPDTVIICCALTSVVPEYAGVDGLTAAMALEANEWIKQVCIDTGAYYADAGAVLRDSSGNLLTEFASSNGKALNSSALDKILEYLRTHTV